MVRSVAWQERSLCDESTADLFYTNEDDDALTAKEKTEQAKSICMACPVRRECLQFALDTEERFGVWGAADENQIRRALSIDQYGHPVIRLRDMKCPYCSSKDIETLDTDRIGMTVKCGYCKLKWFTRKKTEVIHVDAEKEDNDDNMGADI